MRALVQRVSEASVSVDGKIVGSIGKGLLVFLAVGRTDEESDTNYLVNKITNLRVFYDDEEKFNQSCLDVGGHVLLVSQLNQTWLLILSET
jgi:D-tyrosyl-tRNA(Tyr) deacylase